MRLLFVYTRLPESLVQPCLEPSDRADCSSRPFEPSDRADRSSRPCEPIGGDVESLAGCMIACFLPLCFTDTVQVFIEVRIQSWFPTPLSQAGRKPSLELGISNRSVWRVSRGFPEGFRRVSGGFPEGFRGFPEGLKGFPALEYVFRPYETKVQASENFRPSALIKIKEMLKHRNPGGPALGLPVSTPAAGLLPPSRILPRYRYPVDFYYFPG